MNKKMIIAFAAVALLCAGGAGGAVWYFAAPKADAEHVEEDGKQAKGDAKARKKKKEEKSDEEVEPLKYLTVDKVIVMLRRGEGENVSHYLSADLVVATPVKQEKEAKEHLPMLRSVAVRQLSGLSVDKARGMTIDQFAEELNKAYEETYEKDGRDQPFKEVMIGKLIIE
ncbi:flagellar basal body-associated FliL family protein [Pseudoduganella chitinolytica]|uniref:Flagellar protein FliL n=1 Tax=Pseudoduganella chitinolytica TaxID=34070 RepID=A0ABY8BH70_9BURK|nr:flagellar basal body-associated FliL family protein [Pseudoduganella chitinolytica]WEF34057.1 flagellar basal body-associated FliL family protein [Pseudoduganella chitinolytica]